MVVHTKLTTLVINDAAGSGTGVDITLPVFGAGDGNGGTTGNVTIGNATGGGHITFSGSGAHAFNIDGKLTLIVLAEQIASSSQMMPPSQQMVELR